jgi:hypothetical protein
VHYVCLSLLSSQSVSQSPHVPLQHVHVVYRQTRYDTVMMFIRNSIVKTESIRSRMISMISLDSYIINQLLIKFFGVIFSGKY